jgi:hypothetical protein
MIDTEKMKALALAATQGPWEWVNPVNDEPRQPGEWRASLRTVEKFPTQSIGTLPKFIIEADEICDENREANAAFIAAANPAAILELIAALEAAAADKRDAERYRMLRDFGKDGVKMKPPVEHVHAMIYSHMVGAIPASRVVTGDELDRAIDAALSQRQEES